MCRARSSPSISGIMPSIRAIANGWPRAAADRRASRAAGPSADGDRPGTPVRQDLVRIRRLVALSSTIRTGSPSSRNTSDSIGPRGQASSDWTPSVIVNQKVLPMPGSLSTPIRPPIISTSLAEIARPSPVPPNRRVVEPSACSNGSKIACSFSAGMPMPVSAIREAEDDPVNAGLLQRDSDDDLALLGELDGVADQVDQDLAQPAGVADQRVGDIGGDPAGQLQALGVRRSARVCSVSFHGFAQRERCRVEAELAGLDLGEIEDVVDDRQQRIGRAFHQAEVLALPRRQVGVEGQLGHADDAVHRRADLVAHVGEELALGPAGGQGG